MARTASTYINCSKKIKHPSRYIQALYSDYKGWAFDESSAERLKGKWREVFKEGRLKPLHLEIGPGSGKHFALLCLNKPEDLFLSVELKYKPLIQTIRRVRKNQSSNGKAIRHNARFLDKIFAARELNNIYIHFPDPWLKKSSQKKHQLIQEDFCKTAYSLQKPKSFLEFKTDSEDYFNQSVEFFLKAGYKIQKKSLNLWSAESKKKGGSLQKKSCRRTIQTRQTFYSLLKKPFEPSGFSFFKKSLSLKSSGKSLSGAGFKDRLSQFELLFFQKGIPIKYALFLRP